MQLRLKNLYSNRSNCTPELDDGTMAVRGPKERHERVAARHLRARDRNLSTAEESSSLGSGLLGRFGAPFVAGRCRRAITHDAGMEEHCPTRRSTHRVQDHPGPRWTCLWLWHSRARDRSGT